MSKRIAAILMSLIIVLGSGMCSYHIDIRAEELSLYSLSAVLMDADTGRVLYGRDEDVPRANASTTKIMTLILALEYGNVDDMVTVSSYAARMPDVQLGIVAGEQYRLEDLLYSMILESHNDSAVAIAEHIGGDVSRFADMMNNKALELGLSDTYFITPNGLDAIDEGGTHHTTAKDLALIMRYCIKDSPKRDEFISICQTRSHSFTDYEGKRSFTVNNKNAFLDMYEGVIAGKTGFTGDAGYCYVCAVEKDGKTFIIALLGCGWPNNRSYKWSDTRKMIAYGDENYELRQVLDASYRLDDIHVTNGIEDEYLSLYIKDELSLLMAPWEDVRLDMKLPDEVAAPVSKDEIVGEVDIYIGDELFAVYNIYAGEDIERIDYRYFFRKVVDRFLL